MEGVGCFDIETSSVSVLGSFRIFCGHYKDKQYITHSPEEAAQFLASILDAGDLICGHGIVCFDLPYILHHAKKEGTNLLRLLRLHRNAILDTLVASRITRGVNRGNSMASWVGYMREADIEIDDKHQIDNWETASEEDIELRVTQDVVIQRQLYELFSVDYGARWEKLPCFSVSLIYPALIESIAYGLPVLQEKISTITEKLALDKALTRGKIFLSLGEFNPNSNLQLNEKLVQKYGEGLQLSEKGNPQFNKENKHKMVALFPALEDVAVWKEDMIQLAFLTGDTKKQITNPEWCRETEEGHFSYPTYSFMSQVTYRSSYSSPPLNQCDKRIRAVVGQRDCLLVGCDVVGLEWAALGQVLQDRFQDSTIKNEIKNGVDAKQETLEVMGELFDNIPQEKKLDVAKRLNYAVAYGQRLNSTLKMLHLDDADSDVLADALETRFPSLERLRQELEEEVALSGSFRNLYGLAVESGGHKDISYLPQSTGAIYSYCLLGLFHLKCSTYFGDISFRCILHNHDELQLLVKSLDTIAVKDAALKAKNAAEKDFTKLTGMELFTGLDIIVGKTWGESH